MKKLFIILAASLFAIACDKAEDLRTATFPGYSGSGESASWVVYQYRLTDTVYLKTALAAQTPPRTLRFLDSTLNASKTFETGPYSLRLYKSGEVGIITRNGQNQPEWTKQGNLKWDTSNDFMNIYRNVNGSWQSIIEATPEQDKMVCKFKRAYWGDNSANKNLVAAEIIYNSFRIF
jgi:hypothetical protein